MKNSITLLLTYLFIALLLSKCSSGDEFNENELNEDNKLDQIASIIDKTTIDTLKLSQSSKKWCQELYHLLKNESIWIRNESLSQLNLEFFDYLNSDIALNLPIGHLAQSPFNESDPLTQKEIVSVLRCAEYLYLKETTLINYSENKLNQLKFVSPEKFAQFLNEKKDAETWVQHLIKFQEKNQNLIQFHFALNRFTSKYGLENNIDNKIYLKTPEDSLANVLIAKQLYNRNFIGDTLMDTTTLKSKLRSFQNMNGLNADGKLGKKTFEVLKTTNYTRYLKGIIALDKMRAFPDSLIGGKLILVNIPSYLLHFYIGNDIVNTSKVIVGTQRNQTPTFVSTMKYITINPSWHVPYSIASKEILPRLKVDTSYLKNNNYTLLDRDKNRVNTDSLDWTKFSSRNFPFFIHQDPGASNSLGLVKLMFPNENSIYIHDTPSRYLFARDERAFSHGCIRAESPFELVRDILSNEDHPYLDSIQQIKKRFKESFLILKDTFPVAIVYMTSGLDDSTKQVQFYKDIYKKESELYNLFSEPSVDI